ncbi:MAG TPA: FAD-linked oxidase C-terminal domain-containing protein [Streptosporangiaceae bacterium]|jgi:FAD/FMN-containing dehydrogenase/Fe-S oxidoreductase|nr:FAD-linked oxidase C-terminal domain-containing protein [Streptosporangiaceae bacterium]
MTGISLPDPVVRRAAPALADPGALERDLRRRVDGEVRFDAGSRGAYSTDASNYRQVPIGVVVPRTVDAGAEAVAVCHQHGAPVVSRGGGTSLAGQTCNAAVVIDWSKYCRGVISVDADAGTCVVEPGIVLDELNDQLAPHGLMFGPRPATHDHCTLGGMLGNNSCGATAQAYGKVADNVVRLEILTYDGERFWAGPTSDAEYAAIIAAGGGRSVIYQRLRELIEGRADLVRERYPRIPRRVSGYNLDSLLPESGFNVARALVGSESTLVTILHAELRLVPSPAARTLVVLGYPDIAAAADASARIAPHQPEQLEGVDARLIGFERERRMNAKALELLPEGNGWLMVIFAGDSKDEADAKAHALLNDLAGTEHEPTVRFYDDPEHEQELADVREEALGATARAPDMPDTWEGWEDSAVPPERLGDYLRDLLKLYDEFGYSGSALYGHFGQGCVHTRIPFDLVTSAGIATFRRFIERAADLVVSYGGSFSGEHGDGQSRAELLPRLFGDDVVDAFARFKAIFDPGNRMNPGKLVAPYKIDENLRLGTGWAPRDYDTYFGYPDDNGQFERAVMRCVGVGKCRHGDGGVMCPSYMVTREEENSTRGRSRLLFEMLEGHADSPVTAGWRSTEVKDALDLCLACKGCKRDCPTGVDMATMKAEFMAHHYQGRPRPLAHYSMGWLPAFARLASRAPRLVNALSQAPVLRDLVTVAGGIDRRRRIPLFADQTFQAWHAGHDRETAGLRGEVVLWPDTFTNHLTPAVGQAAVEVLESAGWRVIVPEQPLCCGLTWISTGQLATAQRVLRRTVDALAPYLRRGVKVVGLEPSCTAVFRSDARELMPGDRDVQRLRDQTVTLAELLRHHTDGWQPPRIDGRAIAQTHCHQHAIMGYDEDKALLAAAGLDVDVLDAGCCGLAGNFGFEAGHYDVSMACAERVLLPAVRDAPADALVLADGFSCRTQIEQAGTGRTPAHLAEVLAAGLRGQPVRPSRPAPPSPADYARLAGIGAGAALGAGLAVAARRRKP